MDKDNVVMVGDNYNTDIMAGINNGLDTILTLTGVTSLEEVKQEKIQPTHIVDNLDNWKL